MEVVLYPHDKLVSVASKLGNDDFPVACHGNLVLLRPLHTESSKPLLRREPSHQGLGGVYIQEYLVLC